jgi:nucleotide-binding universal stress UspA family protein
MHFKTILAITDLSVRGNQAVDRATLVAENCGAALRLMYVPAYGNPPCRDHARRLLDLSNHVAKKSGLSVQAILRPGVSLEDVALEAYRADLVVRSYRAEHSVSSFVYGAWHEQFMRLCPRAVLLTRLNGRRPYERVLVAVALKDTCRQLVHIACDIEDRADVELFHAISTADVAKLWMTDASWNVIDKHRERQSADVEKQITALLEATASNGKSMTYAMSWGDLGHQALQHQDGRSAGLIVIGKKRRSAFLALVSKSVSTRVLAKSSGDVLIVPHDHRPSSRAAAILRMDPACGDGRGNFPENGEAVL